MLIAFAVDVQNHVGQSVWPANVNETIIFSCDSMGVAKWFYEESRYYPKSNPIINSNKLIIEPAEVKDSGYYYCYGISRDTNKHFMSRIELRVYGNYIVFDTQGTVI